MRDANLDELIGNDVNANPDPARDPFARDLAAMAQGLKDRPAKLQAFISGLAHQGVLTRPAVASALAPFLKLPPPEPRTHKRARMARLISETVAATGQVTRDDLLGGGFSEADLTTLFRDALRVSDVQRMAA